MIEEPENSKLYILIRETIWRDHPGLAICGVAHAAMAAYVMWEENTDFQLWKENSWKKVVCTVDNDQWQQAAEKFDRKEAIIMTESAIKGQETVMVVHPVHWQSGFLNRLKLFTIENPF